jgi:hypothetical protein
MERTTPWCLRHLIRSTGSRVSSGARGGITRIGLLSRAHGGRLVRSTDTDMVYLYLQNGTTDGWKVWQNDIDIQATTKNQHDAIIEFLIFNQNHLAFKLPTIGIQPQVLTSPLTSFGFQKGEGNKTCSSAGGVSHTRIGFLLSNHACMAPSTMCVHALLFGFHGEQWRGIHGARMLGARHLHMGELGAGLQHILTTKPN